MVLQFPPVVFTVSFSEVDVGQCAGELPDGKAAWRMCWHSQLADGLSTIATACGIRKALDRRIDIKHTAVCVCGRTRCAGGVWMSMGMRMKVDLRASTRAGIRSKAKPQVQGSSTIQACVYQYR